jgi:hypothetical protein
VSLVDEGANVLAFGHGHEGATDAKVSRTVDKWCAAADKSLTLPLWLALIGIVSEGVVLTLSAASGPSAVTWCGHT